MPTETRFHPDLSDISFITYALIFRWRPAAECSGVILKFNISDHDEDSGNGDQLDWSDNLSVGPSPEYGAKGNQIGDKLFVPIITPCDDHRFFNGIMRRQDILDFKSQNSLDKVIVLWTANTERFASVEEGINDTSENL